MTPTSTAINKAPAVSIAMPVYNDIAFVRLALESLLAQTFRDFELIILDDTSTDGSADVCREFAKRDERIRYFRNPENQGISRCMSQLLKLGRGEFFMFAADDDLWAETFIEQLVDALRSAPDCMLAFAPYSLIDESGQPVNSAPVRRINYAGNSAKQRLETLAAEWDDGPGYGLFRRVDMSGVRFPRWRGVNATCAYNNIYPSLHFYLAKKNYRLVGQTPLWFNRIKTKPNHTIPYAGALIAGYGAFVLRKLNLAAESLRSVHDGSDSLTLTAQIAPTLAKRIARDCAVELLSAVRARLAPPT